MVGKRFSAYLKEEFYNSFSYRTGTIEVFKNPSKSEMDMLLREIDKEQGKFSTFVIKGLLLKNDLYVWHGDPGHDWIAKVINIYGSACIPLYLDAVLHAVEISTTMMSGKWYTAFHWSKNEDRTEVHSIVDNNPALARAVGYGYRVEET